MGILRRLRQWREDATGTLIGPDIDAETINADSVNTEKTDSGEYLRGGSDIEQWVLIDRQTNVSSIDVQTEAYETLKVSFTTSGSTIVEMTV
ncbi:MAG TPA: hypothetical protein VKP88_00150, partial [Candidatus Paceibacterota bacterium]|nr:hypothetical protein [Candidatus Paceibacterota bacterium]